MSGYNGTAAECGTYAGSRAVNSFSGAGATPNPQTAADLSTRDLVRWLTSHTRPVHKPLYVSTAFRIINLSLDIVLFALAGGGVAEVLTRGGQAANFLGWLVVVALVKAVAYYCEQLSGHYVAFKALELLRTMVFSQMWPKAPAIVASSRSGDVLASLTRDVDRIEVVYAHTFAPVVSALIVPPVAVLAGGFAFGWTTAIVPVICVALALFVVPFVGLRRSMHATRHTLALRRDLAHHVTDSVFGADEVVGYGRIEERLGRMEAIGAEIAESAEIARRGNAVRRAGNVLLTLVAVIGVVVFGMAAGHSVVTLAALAGGTLRLFEGPRGIEDSAGYLDHSFAAARRLWDICHEPERVSDGPKELALDTAPTVTFDEVSYTYPNAYTGVLDGVSFTVRPGGHVVLVGPSGSGKSTAISMLLRYDDPAGGSVKINGVDVREYTLDSLRAAAVVVSQKNQLLNTSIRENVVLGAPDVTEAQIWDALEKACVADDVREMPKGLDTPVGQGGSQLSGGQAQRLCLARALLMNPKILVLDEVTAQLNAELEAQIRTNIAALDMTIIEITHRFESVAADLVVLLDRGTIVASGTPEEIESNDGSLAQFFARNV